MLERDSIQRAARTSFSSLLHGISDDGNSETEIEEKTGIASNVLV